MLSDAERRLENNAQNIANVVTPGYKAGSSFASFLQDMHPDIAPDAPDTQGIDFKNGQIKQTGNPLDLAIEGAGFFVLKNGGPVAYTRNGQFRRDGDGRIVNSAGMALQGVSGDLVVSGDSPEILADGTVLDRGEPVGRLQLVSFSNEGSARRQGGNFVSAADNVQQVEAVRVGQGMLETSNVSMAHEILSIMQVQRTAETGQHLIQLYDDLMTRALTTFGQS